jgi:arabinan endo-1,5-alpha-L-arabinosidase
VVVAKSENLKGPYVDSNGKNMFGPNRGDRVVVPSLSGVMGVGHNGLITDDAGDVWMIYHGYDVDGPKPDWRVTYLDKLLWNEETGMPYVENTKASEVEKPGPYINALEENN